MNDEKLHETRQRIIELVMYLNREKLSFVLLVDFEDGVGGTIDGNVDQIERLKDHFNLFVPK